MEKVRILAFDPGTANCGYGCIEGDEKSVEILHYFGTLKTSKDDGTVRERIDRIGHQMAVLIKGAKPTHIAIEDFTEQGKLVGKTYKEMSWLTEHMRMVAREAGYEVVIYENGEWKKIAMGAMRANKEQVKHYVTHHLPGAKELLVKQPTHVWDSFGIGLAHRKTIIQGVK